MNTFKYISPSKCFRYFISNTDIVIESIICQDKYKLHKHELHIDEYKEWRAQIPIKRYINSLYIQDGNTDLIWNNINKPIESHTDDNVFIFWCRLSFKKINKNIKLFHDITTLLEDISICR